ncbi:hypothetical protein F5B20DRAFT_589291 [Whalleya microplaca]|nr:hypothetical protein F5B20DRAFT_589291 [Whalleya microplaca]
MFNCFKPSSGSRYDPINYQLRTVSGKEKREQIRQPVVSQVFAIGYGSPLGEDWNRWSLGFQFDSNMYILLEIVPKTEGSKQTKLVATMCGGDIFAVHNRVAPLFIASKGPTVGEYFDLLLEHGRDKYELADSGAGMAKWVADAVELFYKQRYLASKEQVQEVLADIEKQWLEHRPTGKRSALVAGRYLE